MVAINVQNWRFIICFTMIYVYIIYYVVLCHITLHYIIFLYIILLYYTILYYTITLYYIILNYIISYYIVFCIYIYTVWKTMAACLAWILGTAKKWRVVWDLDPCAMVKKTNMVYGHPAILGTLYIGHSNYPLHNAGMAIQGIYAMFPVMHQAAEMIKSSHPSTLGSLSAHVWM